MAKFGLFACMFLLGLSATESLQKNHIVGSCQPAPKIIFHKGGLKRNLYDPRGLNCTWNASGPDGHQVRFVCREILKPDEEKCVVDNELLTHARSRHLYNFSCGKKMFNVFSNGPVVKLKLKTGRDEERTYRCDLEAVPDNEADCSCKSNGDSRNKFSCLAAIMTTKLEEIKCRSKENDKLYHLASGFCEINLTPEEISAITAAGDSVISVSHRSKFIPEPIAYRVDYNITLAAVEKDAELNWNAIPLCLQGNLPFDKFDGQIISITAPSADDTKEQCMQGIRITHSQCSSHRVNTNPLNDRQICTMQVDLVQNENLEA